MNQSHTEEMARGGSQTEQEKADSLSRIKDMLGNLHYQPVAPSPVLSRRILRCESFDSSEFFPSSNLSYSTNTTPPYPANSSVKLDTSSGSSVEAFETKPSCVSSPPELDNLLVASDNDSADDSIDQDTMKPIMAHQSNEATSSSIDEDTSHDRSIASADIEFFLSMEREQRLNHRIPGHMRQLSSIDALLEQRLDTHDYDPDSDGAEVDDDRIYSRTSPIDLLSERTRSMNSSAASSNHRSPHLSKMASVMPLHSQQRGNRDSTMLGALDTYTQLEGLRQSSWPLSVAFRHHNTTYHLSEIQNKINEILCVIVRPQLSSKMNNLVEKLLLEFCISRPERGFWHQEHGRQNEASYSSLIKEVTPKQPESDAPIHLTIGRDRLGDPFSPMPSDVPSSSILSSLASHDITRLNLVRSRYVPPRSRTPRRNKYTTGLLFRRPSSISSRPSSLVARMGSTPSITTTGISPLPWRSSADIFPVPEVRQRAVRSETPESTMTSSASVSSYAYFGVNAHVDSQSTSLPLTSCIDDANDLHQHDDQEEQYEHRQVSYDHQPEMRARCVSDAESVEPLSRANSNGTDGDYDEGQDPLAIDLSSTESKNGGTRPEDNVVVTRVRLYQEARCRMEHLGQALMRGH